eukprot:CAMPEP_0113554208 /NCGR_PEP_ID=MMETSP0015_2-20120614/16025_1 /TAXON_ID=2838 /ORGANISM="Odontella" /LENGTH=459 /DNA_ID=CAMNT_0000455331 /DNA_START=282 /DNA_END=1661 /DNA_ORIENTATION=- /assembly_acc=CAM_ASM_000160
MLIDHDLIVTAILAEGNPAPTYDDFHVWQKKQNKLTGEEWVYKLCPETTIDMGDVSTATDIAPSGRQTVMPIVPAVMNSVIQCGENGSPDDNCIVTGGLFQVVFEDDLRVNNVTFAGITFKDSRLISVAAFGHQVNDGTFINCIWTEHFISPFLVNLMYDPNMDFGIIEPPGNGRRRMTESKEVSKIGAFNIRTAFSVDWETTSHVLNRAKEVASRGLQVPTYPGMLVVFRGCKILGNLYSLYGIINGGGRIELDETTFGLNKGVAAVVVRDDGQLAMHGGTTFTSNTDVFGPVFLAANSRIVENQNVIGQNNVAMDLNGVPIADACSAIFKENDNGSDCLATGEICVGRCCDFGMPDCFKGASPEVVQPTIQRTEAAEGGGGGGCDTTCIIFATVVPVCTIALILCGVWFVRRCQMGKHANSPSNTSEPAVPSAPPPPTLADVDHEGVQKFDNEHHIS